MPEGIDTDSASSSYQDPDFLSKPLTQNETEQLCTQTARAVHNLRLALPFYKEILASSHQSAADQRHADQARYFDWRLIDNMVKSFEQMHERNCTGIESVGSTQVQASGNLRRSRGAESAGVLNPARAAAEGAAKKTMGDFYEMCYALPFHSLLEVGVKESQQYAHKEKEYFRRQGEMEAYIAQVKKYGLAGGRKLQDPSEFWAEESKDFWNAQQEAER